jgi:hypothetical protein
MNGGELFSETASVNGTTLHYRAAAKVRPSS